ncbi:uncharacterized protein LOC129950562 [Eupeodes corollae]|uniref:uncharacterized protein LOC129950562 n=1 Tax=Eupeodes corollae TaxID=290404 RepID=UPI0024933811|nr:uncharacterized protein LOC129950562 [Eupeodes corollae]
MQENQHVLQALIDPGSEVSFISDPVHNRLKLPFHSINSQICGINSAHAATAQKLCTFSLLNEENPSKPITGQAIVLKHLTNHLPISSFQLTDLGSLEGLKLADPTFNKSSQVDFLLGADLYPAIIRPGLLHISPSLIAQNTLFGWVLSGPLPHHFHTFTTFISSQTESDISFDMNKFWELEEIRDTKPSISNADQYCEDLYINTTRRLQDGRYVVKLPFKPKTNINRGLGLSRQIALYQFLRSERSLASNPVLQSTYSEVISEYIRLGHMKKVDAQERFENGVVSSYYLPHHAVIKPESVSTKVRVVFNASSPSSNGTSLNDLLHAGPVLQRDLLTLILR